MLQAEAVSQKAKKKLCVFVLTVLQPLEKVKPVFNS